jgi:drug/metabolite transporter (DMT)-like permease
VTPAHAGVAAALASAAGYGLNAVTAQMAAQVGATGALLVFYRVFLMLAVVLAAVMILRQPLRVAPGERGALLVFGLTSSVIGTAYLSSVAFLPVSVAVVVFYLFPVFIILAEPFVERRPLDRARAGIAFVALLGVALVVGARFEGLDPRGLALALLAAFGAAIQFFAAARMPRTPNAAKLFWGHLLVLPGVVLTLAVTDGWRGPEILGLAPWAVAITLGAYVLSIALQLHALARISAATAGLAFCAEPIFATLFAALLLGERLSMLQAAGAALVVAAIAANAVLAFRAAAPTRA